MESYLIKSKIIQHNYHQPINLKFLNIILDQRKDTAASQLNLIFSNSYFKKNLWGKYSFFSLFTLSKAAIIPKLVTLKFSNGLAFSEVFMKGYKNTGIFTKKISK